MPALTLLTIQGLTAMGREFSAAAFTAAGNYYPSDVRVYGNEDAAL
jgi:hypothetical protein